jgi:hypothetical protein
MKTAKVKWECPECKAPPSQHGKGGGDTCKAHVLGGCPGFVCECVMDEDRHGESQNKPCVDARCYHCGWEGRFPPLPKKLQPFEKKALEAGWTPPKGWIGS